MAKTKTKFGGKIHANIRLTLCTLYRRKVVQLAAVGR